MVLSHENIRKIHKKLYQDTINQKKLFPIMVKIANKSRKTINPKATTDENAGILLLLFSKMDYNGKTKKIINKIVVDEAERGKDKIIKSYISDSRSKEKWLYLASSHSDSALDHKPYQGKIYYDSNAPKDIVEYAKSRGWNSLQWVMGSPVWFVTRPNCRHFFKALPTDVVKQYSRKDLIRRYKMHRMDGDRELATPRSIAIEEYTDRLHMLEGMYSKKPTENLRRHIEKTKILLKKWKNNI